MNATLPSFDNPPVIETVVGVEFSPLENWAIPHFGLFWQELREDFPKYQVQPTLSSSIESFGDARRNQPSVSLQFSQSPEARCWFVSADDRELVQVQRDRFLFNWRKGESNTEYPRYAKFVRPGFEEYWKIFNDFVEKEKIGTLSIIQCEVSYVNHIPLEGTSAHWGNILTIAGETRPGSFLESPETSRYNVNFLMPEEKGRLRITATEAVRESDGEKIIVLTLTARGRPASSSLSDVLAWLDLGREWVVRGFADITSESLHEHWGRNS